MEITSEGTYVNERLFGHSLDVSPYNVFVFHVYTVLYSPFLNDEEVLVMPGASFQLFLGGPTFFFYFSMAPDY